METKKSIHFTVVPDEREDVERIYANFCAVAHTPFDFTLTFCEIGPLGEKDLAGVPEGGTRVIAAPVKAKIVVPAALVPALAAALEENLRVYREAYSNVGWTKGGVH